MTKYVIHNRLKAIKDRGDELAAILLEASVLLATNTSCSLYMVCKDINNEDHIWITEVWGSKEDHTNSLKNDAVRALITKAIPLLDRQPEKGNDLLLLGGKGI